MQHTPRNSVTDRITDFRRRLNAMRTVTNTASSQISGGETIIDQDGGVSFRDGGQLVLGSSSIITSRGESIISESGDLTVDSLNVYGDVLSAQDYLYQREVASRVIVDTDEAWTRHDTVDVDFPDWASSMLATVNIYLSQRISTPRSNKVLIQLNGKPVARPRSNELGDILVDSSITRTILPENPNLTVSTVIGDSLSPTDTARITIKVSGVFSA